MIQIFIVVLLLIAHPSFANTACEVLFEDNKAIEDLRSLKSEVLNEKDSQKSAIVKIAFQQKMKELLKVFTLSEIKSRMKKLGPMKLTDETAKPAPVTKQKSLDPELKKALTPVVEVRKVRSEYTFSMFSNDLRYALAKDPSLSYELILDIQTNSEVFKFDKYTDLSSVVFLADNESIFYRAGNTFVVYNLKNKNEVSSYVSDTFVQDKYQNLAVSENGESLILYYTNKDLEIVNLKTEAAKVIKTPEVLSKIHFSVDNKTVYLLYNETRHAILDIQSQKITPFAFYDIEKVKAHVSTFKDNAEYLFAITSSGVIAQNKKTNQRVRFAADMTQGQIRLYPQQGLIVDYSRSIEVYSAYTGNLLTSINFSVEPKIYNIVFDKTNPEKFLITESMGEYVRYFEWKD